MPEGVLPEDDVLSAARSFEARRRAARYDRQALADLDAEWADPTRRPSYPPGHGLRDMATWRRETAVVAVLRAAHAPLSIHEIIRVLACCGRPGERFNPTVGMMKKLIGSGHVVRVDRGLYAAGPNSGKI